jgi:hypothetical protein
MKPRFVTDHANRAKIGHPLAGAKPKIADFADNCGFPAGSKPVFIRFFLIRENPRNPRSFPTTLAG